MQASTQNKRHMLHGAINIRTVLQDLFARIKLIKGAQFLTSFIGGVPESKVINKAVNNRANKVAGSEIANKGIENARKSIDAIKRKIDIFCMADRSFIQVKLYAIGLICSTLNRKAKDRSKTRNKNGKEGKISIYGGNILQCLENAIIHTQNELQLASLINDFSLSVTLDVVHEGTSKEQNNDAIVKSIQLRQAIFELDDATTFDQACNTIKAILF